MTINREMQLYTVRDYTEGIDEYGAIRKGYTDRLSKMLIKINNQANEEDPRDIDCDLIAITEDKTINDTNSIIYKDKLYDVKYIIPSKKYHILFLNNVG